MNPSYEEIPCVILCGGRSSRMGEDKSLLPFDSYDTLTQYQYERLKPYFKNLYISSKIDKFPFLTNKDNLILDTNEIFSPVIALKSILDKLKSDKIFIITVDTPLVKVESMIKLINEIDNNDICVAKTQRVHNLCGVFSNNIIDTIDEMIKNDIHKVGYILKNNKCKEIEFPNDDEFINVNNKDEYKRSVEIIKNTSN